MRQAISLGREAAQVGEVPVGAILVLGDEVIAASYNGKERMKDPTAHAEILVIREAATRLGRWRLPGPTPYVRWNPVPCVRGHWFRPGSPAWYSGLMIGRLEGAVRYLISSKIAASTIRSRWSRVCWEGRFRSCCRPFLGG